MEGVEGLGNQRGPFRYKNIFLVGSVLHGGNTVEYFSKHTEKLVVFYLLITLRDRQDFIQIYKKGRLIKEQKVFSPKTPFIYYFFVYFWYARALFTYFSRKDSVYIIAFHPVFFLLQSCLKFFRNVHFVLWVIDYIPDPTGFLKMYQWLLFYYHRFNIYNVYLSDGVNKMMNGKVKKNFYQKTIMWGVKKQYSEKKNIKNITLGFVGVIKKTHGLDIVFRMLKSHRNIHIKILGECDVSLYKEYQEIIKKLHIQSQVFFPNAFFSLDSLKRELSSCRIGVALYTTDINNPIHYTDPGKVKTYTQFGLPVIMSNTSAIAFYIKKYKVGMVIKRTPKALYDAIVTVAKNYSSFVDGVKKFNKHFSYESYYRKRFLFLEE